MNKQAWLELGLAKGFTDLEFFITHAKSTKLSLYQGKLDQNVQSDVQSLSIRAIYQGKLVSARLENLSTETIEHTLDVMLENAKAITASEPAIIFEGSESYPEVKVENFPFVEVPIEEKIQLVHDLEASILKADHVKQVQSTMYQENENTTEILNSKGLNLKRSNTFAYAYAVGVFEKDDDIKTAYDIKLVKSFDQFDANVMASETVRKGQAKLGGKSLKSGAYPVVFSNEMFADILGVFTSIFTGEAAYRNLTALKDKVGQSIASSKITLIDNPLHEDAYFQTPFDDEGVACQPFKVVDQGVFKGWMHNLKTAAIFKEAPTGHGFGGAIRPTNFYLEPKDTSFEGLISAIDQGVYITDLVGLHAGVKTVSGDFSLQAGGFKIEQGKITTPVKMIVVSGNFFKMLNQIEAIGNDLKFGLSGTGSPSVHAGKLMIGGDE